MAREKKWIKEGFEIIITIIIIIRHCKGKWKINFFSKSVIYNVYLGDYNKKTNDFLLYFKKYVLLQKYKNKALSFLYIYKLHIDCFYKRIR